MKKIIFIAIASMLVLAACTENPSNPSEKTIQNGTWRQSLYSDNDNIPHEDPAGYPDVQWVFNDNQVIFQSIYDSTGVVTPEGFFTTQVTGGILTLKDGGVAVLSFSILEATDSTLGLMIKDNPSGSSWKEKHFEK